MFSKRLLGLLLALAPLLSVHSWAGVTAERTRVIIEEGQREASLALVNQNAYPVIVQTWVDNGELDAEPDTAQAPFMPLPPVFRLNARQQHSLRILSTGQGLPTDRESLYWLNLYEIPPQDNTALAEGQARLTVTLRTQMKIIYRPTGLKADAEQAHRQLRFTLDGARVRVENTSPCYISLVGASVRRGSIVVSLPGDTLAPFSQSWLEGDAVSLARGDEVEYGWIDDGGNTQTGKSMLQ